MAKSDIFRGLVVAGDILGTVNRINRAIDDANHEIERDCLRRELNRETFRRARAEMSCLTLPTFGDDEVSETRAKLKSKIAKEKMKLIDCDGPFSKNFDPFEAGQIRQKIRKLERVLDDLD